MVIYSALLIASFQASAVVAECPAPQLQRTESQVSKVVQPEAARSGKTAETIDPAMTRKPARLKDSDSEFVADEIQPVFESIVESSVDQMTAYGEMIDQTEQAVDRFKDTRVRSEALEKTKLNPECKPLAP